MKVKGVNLGNWLVLEKWMSPALFEGTTAEDEYYLPAQLSPEVYEARIRVHRSEYITERDFATIKRIGFNTVRIPAPYFVFGDRPPFIGCIEEMDKDFSSAEKYGRSVRTDLTTAGSAVSVSGARRQRKWNLYYMCWRNWQNATGNVRDCSASRRSMSR